ncbi:MAG: histidine--tRNA ligase family protein [bacterium]|nr:histidine--tRNA ligase family protein [bacterium]
MQSIIQRLPGFYDKLPREAYIAREVTGRLINVMATYGYNLVEAPVVEKLELYGANHSPDFIRRIMNLSHRNTGLCLRPEFTTSIGRMFMEHFQDAPQPLRVCFAGPVFRNETPSRKNRRQFTGCGAEIIGVPGIAAEAEILVMACRSLDALGVTNYRLLLGDMRILTACFDTFQIDNHIRLILRSEIENLRKPKKGGEYVRTRLKDLFEYGQVTTSDQKNKNNIEANDALEYAQLKDSFKSILDKMGSGLSMRRTREEIIERLLKKFHRKHDFSRVMQVLELIEGLSVLSGTIAEVAQRAKIIFTETGVPIETIEHLEELGNILQGMGVSPEHITLDFGLSRGIHYYTGLFFELHHLTSTTKLKLCGGGCHEQLPDTLGTRRQVPAIGFCFGIERLVDVLSETEVTLVEALYVKFLVIPVEYDDLVYAMKVADYVRKTSNLSVEVDLKYKRTLPMRLSRASKRQIPFVIIVGSEERMHGTVTMRNMNKVEQIRLSWEQLESFISKNVEA